MPLVSYFTAGVSANAMASKALIQEREETLGSTQVSSQHWIKLCGFDTRQFILSIPKHSRSAKKKYPDDN